MAEMKQIVIDGVSYEIVDDATRDRMTAAEQDISGIKTGKADAEDVPSKTSDLTNDAGFLSEVPVENVEIDGSSILSNKIAIIPRAGANRAGVIRFDPETELLYVDVYTDQADPYRVPLLNGNMKMSADLLPAATTSKQGAMSAADKEKLNGISVTAVNVTLLANGWSDNTQSVTVAGIEATTNLVVASTPASMQAYRDAEIYCMGQETNTLTFVCDTLPETDISASVLIIKA